MQAGEFDVLLCGVTERFNRAFRLGFDFGPLVFCDGQGLLVRKSLGVTKGTDLDGATVGVQSGTTGELNIADFFRKTNKTFKPVVIEDSKEFRTALDSGRADALTQDASDLAIDRTELTTPDDFILLPKRLSKEPLAPAMTADCKSSTGRSTQPFRRKNSASPARMSTASLPARIPRSSASSESILRSTKSPWANGRQPRPSGRSEGGP